MIEIAAWLTLFVVALITVSNWRAGLALCVMTAIVQDPIRKLVTEQPVYFVLFVGMVFAATCLGAILKRVPILPSSIVGWRKNVGTPYALFLCVIAIQAFHSLIVFNNPTMTGIGLLSYLAPLPALVLGYQFAVRQGAVGVLRWMKFYVIVATLAITSVYFEYMGASWPVLGQIGEGMLISYGDSQYMGSSGFFRATEIAAWHAATIACFSFMLFWGRRFSLPKVLMALLFIAFLIGIGALTGRRKMIIQIAIFVSTYIGLITWFRRGSGKVAVLAAIVGAVIYIGVAGWLTPDPGEQKYSRQYAKIMQSEGEGIIEQRTKTVFEDLPERVRNLGIGPIAWAVDSHGWFGAGLGVGSQGAQHFGAESAGAAEGGLGKLTLELGVPGLLLAAWLFIAFSRYVWRLLGQLTRTAPAYANLAYGFVAFILANVAAFSVATQAYGDVFILLTLGLSLGFLLALPALAQAQAKKQNLQ